MVESWFFPKLKTLFSVVILAHIALNKSFWTPQTDTRTRKHITVSVIAIKRTSLKDKCLFFYFFFAFLDHLCKPNEFKCENSRCVSVDLICNDRNDCYDNSDEAFCCTKFTCDNRRCISNSQVCDMINNCGDWSDEKNCRGL